MNTGTNVAIKHEIGNIFYFWNKNARGQSRAHGHVVSYSGSWYYWSPTNIENNLEFLRITLAKEVQKSEFKWGEVYSLIAEN